MQRKRQWRIGNLDPAHTDMDLRVEACHPSRIGAELHPYDTFLVGHRMGRNDDRGVG